MSFLDDRRRGAEEAFFAKQNEGLRLQLRTTASEVETRAQVAEASGIRSDAVLDALQGLNVGPEGAAALSLIPLVVVAWADGDVSVEEHEALLDAANRAGLEQNGPAHRLFAGWLDEKPSEHLFSQWKAFARAVSGGMAPAERTAFRTEIMARSNAIASAAGGFMGFGKVSAPEDATLKEIAAALDG